MSILDHRWGESNGADYVWAQVAGLRPSQAGRATLMVWQAYIDESADNRFLVLSGYVATAERWAAFSRDWEELLPKAYLRSDGSTNFKMREMAKSEERMSWVLPFFKVIEKHVQLALLFEMDLSEFERARKSVKVFDHESNEIVLNPPWINNPYVFAMLDLLCTMLGRELFADLVEILGNDPVFFYFDERSDKSHLWDAYEAILTLPGLPKFMSPSPRFENDDCFMPLQAADFLAYWGREALSGNAMPWKPVVETKLLQRRILPAKEIVRSFTIFSDMITRRRLEIFTNLTEYD